MVILFTTAQFVGFIFPDFSTLTTSLLQEQFLQTLREHAVVDFKKYSDENRRIRRIMFTVTNDRGSSHHNLLINSYHSGSAVEQAVVTHSVPDTMMTERSLFEKNEGTIIPLTQLKVALVNRSMTSAVI